MSKEKSIWQASPRRVHDSLMFKFSQYAASRTNRQLTNWESLYQWSIHETAEFWSAAADFCQIKWLTPPQASYVPPQGKSMLHAKWFLGGKLNYADNMLVNWDEVKDKSRPMLISVKENREPVQVSVLELRSQVAKCMSYLKAQGVKKGDVVAAVCSNDHYAVIAMLATSALGAVFSSTSPDFGVSGIVDRLAQVNPKVLFFVSDYSYNGKIIDCRAHAQEVLSALGKRCNGILLPGLLNADAPGFQKWSKGIDALSAPRIDFVPCSFEDPLFIMFSSGTTGIPKAIVHSVGGSLLQHKKELMLHCDIKPGQTVAFYTTCGWMMWNWITSALSVGASVLCYDGSPSYPDLSVLWQLIDRFQLAGFGTSPKFLGALKLASMSPKKVAKLESLLSVWSTGSPLSPELARWVYEEVKADLHLGSISGGTDILSCFMLANPFLPVYPGYIQAPGLGMAVEAWDEDGQPIYNKEGELVCTKPFVSMPIGFLNDPGGEKYHSAYFSFYSDEIWRHGDYISIDPIRGIMVFGRSDATLNPGGVRIGTSEIYRQLETIAGIKDSLAIALKREHDEEIVLLVEMMPGQALTVELKKEIHARIQTNLTRRHLPAYIYAVSEIPYTRSGKKVESAATKALNGKAIDNLAAIANPGCLEEYRRIGSMISSNKAVG